jgi:hypothetical protein
MAAELGPSLAYQGGTMFGLPRKNKAVGKGSGPARPPGKEPAELLRGIPDDPIPALQHLAAELDRISLQPHLSPMRIHELVDVVDRTGRPYYRTLADTFLLSHRGLTKFQEERIWATVTAYLSELTRGYRLCLARCEVGASGSTLLMGQLPEMSMRALRASAMRLKWAYLHYRPIQPGHWSEISGLYMLAESAGFARKRMEIYKGARQDSSVEQEFLQTLMLAAASPGSMLPEQVEVAERLIARCAPQFLLAPQAHSRFTHMIDLRADVGPRRVPESRSILATARAFGAGPGLEELKKLDGRIKDGTITLSEIGLTPDIDHEIIRATAQHLLRYWGPPLPARRHPRERHASSVAVLHGFEEVASTLGGLSYPFVSEEEHWVVDNRSREGLHAMVRSPLGRWLSVGSLIAFREGDNTIWTAGLVRRLVREGDDTRMVAVQALARGGAGVTVLPHPAPARQTEGTLCVLLPGPNGVGEEVRLLLPPNTFSESAPLVMRAYERRYLLIPIRLVESSVDFQVGCYQILRPAD